MKYTKLCHIKNFTLHIFSIILTERIETQLFTGDSTTTHDHEALWCNSPDERCKMA